MTIYTPAHHAAVTATTLVGADPYAALAGGVLVVALADLVHGLPARKAEARAWLLRDTPGGGGWYAALLGADELLSDALEAA